MKYAERIIEHLVVGPLLRELEAAPEVWNQHPLRVQHDVFRETDDIWLRYRDPSTVKEPADWNRPHFAVWYPAAEKLPASRPIIGALMSMFDAEHLGGVLITRIPPGKEVKWHTDKGGWHAEFYNRKVYVILKGNEDCVNYFEDEEMVMRSGEAWLFNNLVQHCVVNRGSEPRISLIVCMKVDDGRV